jgi:hypothetical protein
MRDIEPILSPLTFYLNKFRLPLPRRGEESGRKGGGERRTIAVESGKKYG